MPILKPGSLIIMIILFYSCVNIKTKQDIAVSYYNIGNEFYKIENYNQAIEQYKKAIEYNRKFKEAKINLIRSYQKSNQYQKALRLIVKEYKKRISDYNQNLLLLLGNNFFLQEDYETTIKIFSEFIETYPEEHKGYFNLGLAYLKVFNNDQAISYFLKAYEINNQFVPALFNIALFYFNEEEYKNSLYYFNQLIDIEKKNPAVFYRLAILEYHISEFENAKEHFQTAITLDKDNPQYYIWLARVYARAYKNKNLTLKNIELALEKGYDQAKELVNEPDFQALKHYQEFNGLINKYLLKK